MSLTLAITLLSDTTFGRGDGVIGLVDEEIEYDSATGLPFIRGRTLKGLVVEECANILYSLQNNPVIANQLSEVAQWLFGNGGSTSDAGGHLRFGQGTLPVDLQEQVRLSIYTPTGQGAVPTDLQGSSKYTPVEILESLTTIRRQTAVNEETGVPATGSLRSSRVLLRDLTFRAILDFDQKPQDSHLALLTACVNSVRRAGSGRNRGRGKVNLKIESNINGKSENLETPLEQFEQLVSKGKI